LFSDSNATSPLLLVETSQVVPIAMRNGERHTTEAANWRQDAHRAIPQREESPTGLWRSQVMEPKGTSRTGRARRVVPTVPAGVSAARIPDPFDDDAKPKEPRPIDTKPPYDSWRYVIDIDWSLRLSEDATRRIGQQIRQAVLVEIAQLDNFEGDLVLREIGGVTSGLIVRSRG
jgi:hypothetical protein